MSLYMLQAAYTPESWAKLTRNPQDRTQVIREGLQKLGCKLVSFYFAFGEYDTVVVFEAPDEAAAAAFPISLAATGAFKAVKTTVLITPDRATEAMRKAAATPYQVKM
ncbi:MAG: GYD domain-containing protein [Chloroflexi bacterium]|nr:GYD domain-containing protein [Chloroflexota bacterium]